MPLCGKSHQHEEPVQKVLIPKGMVNPHETTIIEIPARLHKQPLVIAKRKTHGPPNNYTSEIYNKKKSDRGNSSLQNSQMYNYNASTSGRRVPDRQDNSFQPMANSSMFEQETMYYDANNEDDILASSTRNNNYSLNQTQSPIRRNKGPPTAVNMTQMLAKPDFDLDTTEREEKISLHKNLEDFQRARRKLLANASYLVNHGQLEN